MKKLYFLLVSFIVLIFYGCPEIDDVVSPEVFTIVYDANGAESGTVPEDATKYVEGSVAAILGNTGSLSKNGYIFLDWNTSPEGDGLSYSEGDEISIGTEIITLYANWRKLYSIVYDGNNADSGSVPVDNTVYSIDDTAVILGNTGNLVRTGFKFVGWSLLQDGSGTLYSEGDNIAVDSDSIILYAQWTSLFTIVYNSNGAESGTSPVDKTQYDEGASCSILGNTGNLTRDGYVFLSWNTKVDGSGSSYFEGDEITFGTETIVLYALWKAFYTITYNANGADSGTVPVDDSSYMEGESVMVLGNVGNLQKDGFIFGGWNVSAEGDETQYLESESLSVNNNNNVLYAVWDTLKLKSFEFKSLCNSSLSTDVSSEINEDTDLVFIKIPHGADLASLIANFKTNGDFVNISGSFAESGVDTKDYTADVVLETGLTGGETRSYIIRVFITVNRTQLDSMISADENISRLDVSEIEDMSSLFKDNSNFNQNISLWDVSFVKDMRYMFMNADSFNQDLSGWDVGNVTTMRGMFRGADVFDQDINSWNVSNVTDMSYMFWNADSFDHNINNWNVQNVTQMKGMFKSADIFNQSLGSWDVGSVSNMDSMFYGAVYFEQDLTAWAGLVKEDVSHSGFSGGSCPLTLEHHPYLSWDE